jgi:hypothetical protein
VTVIRLNGLQWVAAKDGIAHACDNHAPRTLCDRIAVPDRYAWPAVNGLCGTCVARAGKRAPKPRGRRPEVAMPKAG